MSGETSLLIAHCSALIAETSEAKTRGCRRRGAGGGAAREGRISQEVALPVLRRRWRGARPGSGWDRVEHRRARSRPAPPPPPSETCLQRTKGRTRLTIASQHGRAPARGDVGHPHACWKNNRPRPCAPLRSNGCPLSTRGRSTRWSAGGLTCAKAGAICHLPVGFPLRCAQRFSRPDVATRRCCFGNNRHTSGRSSPVLSY